MKFSANDIGKMVREIEGLPRRWIITGWRGDGSIQISDPENPDWRPADAFEFCGKLLAIFDIGIRVKVEGLDAIQRIVGWSTVAGTEIFALRADGAGGDRRLRWLEAYYVSRVAA